jgi:tight adherence protein C
MIWYIVIGVCVAASVLLIFWWIHSLHEEVPDEERQYLDPLPTWLRLIWPLVRLVAYFVSSRFPASVLESTYQKMARAGLTYLMNAEEFMALRLVLGVGAYVLLFLAMRPVGGLILEVLPLAGAVLAFYYPSFWVHKRYEERRKAILKALPVYLDYLTLAMEAGLNLAGSIAQAVEKGPAGPLRHELFLVLRDIRSGLTRSDALRRMDNRLKINEVSSVVSSIVQAEQVGAGLGKVLRLQAERRRIERFQRAEKLAMEAPAKLLFPLVVFIFPTTFIILMFPIVMSILHGGAL